MKRFMLLLVLCSLFLLVCAPAISVAATGGLPVTGDELVIDDWVWWALGLGALALLGGLAYWWYSRRNADVEEPVEVEEVTEETVVDEVVDADDEDYFDIELK